MSDNGIKKFEKLSSLIQGMLTGNLKEDEFQILDHMISDDSECLKYYIEYSTMWALLDETEYNFKYRSGHKGAGIQIS